MYCKGDNIMNSIAIKCENITKTYPMYHNPKDRFKEALHPFRKVYHEDFYALKDVSFDVKKGETVGIIGKNGAGKSTLLKIITGVLTPTSGSAQVNGIVSSLLELGTGFNVELTGIENIYFHSSLMGVSKEDVDKKLQDIINFADIGEHIHQPVRGYSSGMFARLAFAVAISIEPDILIIDEALAVGDMNFQAKCMTAMKRIQSNGATILFVSHDIGSVKSLCERCIYIKDGNVHAVGQASVVAELYIREMREKLNIENNKPKLQENIIQAEVDNSLMKKGSTDVKQSKLSAFKASDEFDRNVSPFRYGTGEAKVRYVELLDENELNIVEVKFNQKIKIRIHLESYSDIFAAVNFQIFDDKKINITAGGFKQQSEELLHLLNMDKYIVDYELKLPLQQGNYSVQVNISSFLEDSDMPIFVDGIPDACVFRVGERPNFPIWSKVDLFPQLSYVKG
jgi:ABC-type polysaccharide/polyol phosphate transport system ATPase subunit